MHRKILSVALSFLTAVSPVLSYADSTYTVKIPTAAVPFVATTASYDFGKVLVGQAPQRTFTFTNTGTDPTTISSVTAAGAAQVLNNTCTGTLAGAQSCSFTAVLNVSTTGPNTGQIQVAHSANTTPNVYSLTATGITADALISAVEPTLSFGDVLVRASSAPMTAHFKNIGATPLDIQDVGLAEGGTNFQVDGSACGTLQPNETCPVSVVFNPQYLGMIQGRLKVTLGDGTTLNMTGLVGNGVQGTPAWSTSQLNYLDIPVGAASAAQSVTLTNSGRGALTLGKLFINGDSSFKIDSTTCGTTLAAGASCNVAVLNTPPDGTIRSAVLELDSTNSSLTVSRVQLYTRPVSAKAVLTVSPLTLDFGSLPVGQTKTANLTLQSTGTLAANVSAYTLSGTNAADFTILNAPTCTGSLAPGQQCVLQVQVKPSSAGARSASLAITADTPEAVPSVPLTANGTVGTLSASTANLNFGNVETGKTATLTSTITNTGQAGVTISAATLGAPAAGFTTSGCVGQTLAAGASCTLTVTFAPTATGAQNSGLALVNTGTPATLPLTLSGTGTAPLLPTATLSPFACPTLSPVSSQFNCSATLTNTSALPLQAPATGIRSDNPAIFGTPWLAPECKGVVAPGASCLVMLVVTAPATAGTYSSTISVSTNGGVLTSKAVVQTAVPSLSLTTTANPPTLINQVSTATHTLTNTGLLPIPIAGNSAPNAITLTAPAQTAYFSKTSTTCEGPLAPGASCTITTSFIPYAAGTYTATIQVLAYGGAGQITLTKSLTGSALVPPAVGSDLVVTPNPIDMGSFGLLPNPGVPKSVLIMNKGKGVITLTGISLQNLQSNISTYSVSPACQIPATLTAGASCTVTVTAQPVAAGTANGIMTIKSNINGGSAMSVNVTGQVTASSLQVTPNPLDFGQVDVGAGGVSQPVTLKNMSSTTSIGVIGPTPSGPDMALFNRLLFNKTPAGWCAWQWSTAYNNYTTTIPPGGSCLDYFTYKPVTAGTSARAVMTYKLMPGASPTSVDVTLLGTGIPSRFPAATMSDFVCTNPLGATQPFTCTSTLRSTGALPLVINSMTTTPVQWPKPTSDCPSTMPPGTSCTVTVKGAFNYWTTVTGTVSVYANLPDMLVRPFTLAYQPPKMTLTMMPHGAVQMGSSSYATHTVTNAGIGSLTFGTPSANVTGATTYYTSPYMVFANTCDGKTLAPGASCTVTTACIPKILGPQVGTFSIGSTAVSASGDLSCSGVAPSASVIAAGSASPDVGGFSRSGNWYRVRNSGLGSVTIQGFYPADNNWTLFSDAANPAHCSVNKVLQPGQDCLVMEVLMTGEPGRVFTGTQRVRTSAGDMTWASSMKTYGVSVQPVSAFPTVQTGSSVAREFKVTNLAPFSLSGIKPSLTGTGFTLTSTTCASLAPAGQAGSVCSVFVTYTAPAMATSVGGTLSITGGYPQIINGAQNPSVGSGIQGAVAITASAVAPNVTVKLNTPPAARLGSYADVTATIYNQGVDQVSLSPAPSLSKGTAFAIVGTSCGGSLAAGASCDVTIRFTPLANSINLASLSVSYNGLQASASLQGTVIPVPDVAVITKGPLEVGTSSTENYTITATNKGGGAASIQLSYAASARDGATIQSLGTPACSIACSVDTATRSVTVTLPAGASIQVTLPVTVGSGLGTIQVDANAFVPFDTDISNNASSAVSKVVAPYARVGDPADMGVCDYMNTGIGLQGYMPAGPRVMTRPETDTLRKSGHVWFCVPVHSVGLPPGTPIIQAEMTLVGFARKMQYVSPSLSEGYQGVLRENPENLFPWNISYANPSTWTRVMTGHVEAMPFWVDTNVDVHVVPDTLADGGLSISMKMTSLHPAVKIYKAESAVYCAIGPYNLCNYTK